MKELSVEQKAKAYDEALKEAIVAHKDEDRHIKATLERIFPELKESEDEMIISRIKKAVESYWSDEPLDEILAWLENQGKPNPYSGVSFEYNGNIWGMCARDNGVDILCDKHIIGHLEKQGEQKSAWSEEDEEMLNHIIIDIESLKERVYCKTLCNEEIIWLKSIKERVQPQQKQEWGEEDEQYLLVCKNALAKYQRTDKWDANIISRWLEDKLKSLRPQKQWKPSEEQMDALNSVRKILHSEELWNEANPIMLSYESLMRDLENRIKLA